MSRYALGKEPACTGNSPTCLKIIRHRGSALCPECSKFARRNTAVVPDLTITQSLAIDRQRTAERAELTSLRNRYKESLTTIDMLEAELSMAQAINAHDINPIEITPSVGTKRVNEATAVLVLSDWHSEEIVNPATLNNKNEHSIEIHQLRQNRLWDKALKLIHLIEEGVEIPTIVLALLGDFISNEIHDADSAENNALKPIDAMMLVENELAGGINFLLEHTSSNLIIDCHSGNHARTTKKVRIASEAGHSLEYYAYSHLARLFAREPRVTFRVNEGYHSFLDIYNVRVRLHHGHAIKYNGGVGGLTIPANKAIAQWNKEMVDERAPNLDIFGHYHQAFDGGNFVCNGSMIGYNAFAKFIKAGYEPPKQMLLVIDKKHGRTCTWPIYVQPTKE
jgi:hypothetical protein